MLLRLVWYLFTVSVTVSAVHFSANPGSDISSDDKNTTRSKMEQSDENSTETESGEKDKKFLAEAMNSILDPTSVIDKTNDEIEYFRQALAKVEKDDVTLDIFMKNMVNLSLEVCKASQQALWSYVTDISNDYKRNKMIRIAAEEDEIKKQYWNILKNKYLNEKVLSDRTLQRKIRIIKERGTNVQMPQSKQREEIDSMQRIWGRVTLCSYYNETTCNEDARLKTMNDVISIFKTSNDTKELVYYWTAYRNATGKKIRPIFKDYVSRMNNVVRSENFSDAGEMWRYAFEDDNFIQTVDRLWGEIKPLYDLLHDYVRGKLKAVYKDVMKDKDNMIPAHILGNLWALEWQSIYPKVAAYPKHVRPKISNDSVISAKDLFDAVDRFHQSLGFESARDSYKDIKESMLTANCLPSSHDMCDGLHYRIKWCGEPITDVATGLSRAARLLGHVQYFKHYRNLSPLFRDGPNPAFHDAISDITAIQITHPNFMKSLNLVSVETGPEVSMNHLLWVALEKVPVMAYAYVLDKWRWDVFRNSSLEKLNEHWWDLRKRETGIKPPVPRDETDLDPAAKYHVVSHVQYITYLISHVLEFQILLSLCRKANHQGPLHECSIHNVKEAGKLLSDGMSLGASEDWRKVLQAITGDTELSTEGFRLYFSTLQDFLRQENAKLAQTEDMDPRTPIIVGVIVVILTIVIVALYCLKKYNGSNKMFSVCSKNGSLDIVNDVSHTKSNEVEGVVEDKV